jgi:hypothetical protein
MTALRLSAAVVLSTAVGFFLHVYYGRGWANAYVQTQAALGRLNDIAREPYPTEIFLAALATALIPTAFQVLLFVLIRDRLPGRSGAVKGLWFGILMLAIGDNLIRMPLMSLIGGNPIDVMLVQTAEAWIIALAKGVLIGALTPADALLLPRQQRS